MRRYLENKASDEELDIFFHLLKAGELDSYLQKALREEEDRSPDGRKENYLEENAPVAVFSLGKWLNLAAAAIITGLLIGGFWYFAKTRPGLPSLTGIRCTKDILPGRNHALLTLPTGKVIDLDSNSAPVVTLQANTRLVRNRNGEWVYHSPTGDSAVPAYNTIFAPRGGQFPFVLEDGTRVWLNAASSLKFPTSFHGTSREVALEGEAYFEVAPSARRTFLVRVRGMQVQVLGTHFDVNAYMDEPAIRTTLLEGSVKIIRDKASALLHQGEQSSLLADGTINTVNDPDLAESAVAWRSGYFSFEEDNIESVMRQISRWYNVDIHYEGSVTRALFGGDIGRDLTLRQVLQVLEKSQVHFRLEGNKLTVLP